MSFVCIYHDNCPDGFASAWVLNNYYQKDIEFIPGVYNEPVPLEQIKGKNVIITDFSFKRKDTLEIAKFAKTVLLIDHHKSAIENLANIEKEASNIRTVFDLDHSGCILTWNYLYPARIYPNNLHPSKLLQHIEDRDLWKFELPGTREIMLALLSYDFDFSIWDALVNDVNGLYKQGEVLLRKWTKEMDNIINQTKQLIQFDEYVVPIVNSPYSYASDICSILCKDYPFAVSYYVNSKNQLVYSLRSSEENGVDVSEIASRFGGGGHKHAAGFKLAIDNYEKFIQVKSM